MRSTPEGDWELSSDINFDWLLPYNNPELFDEVEKKGNEHDFLMDESEWQSETVSVVNVEGILVDGQGEHK